MKRALILLCDGVEATEAIATYDTLRRSHEIDPTFITRNYRDAKAIKTSMEDIMIAGDKKLLIYKEENLNDLVNYFDIVILPGGKVGVDNIKLEFKGLIKAFINANKHVHAICAAPSVLGELGYLEGKKYTCYPGFESPSFKGTWLDKGVVLDKDTVTGRSMGYSVEFALTIIDLECGSEAVHRAKIGIYGLE